MLSKNYTYVDRFNNRKKGKNGEQHSPTTTVRFDYSAKLRSEIIAGKDNFETSLVCIVSLHKTAPIREENILQAG